MRTPKVFDDCGTASERRRADRWGVTQSDRWFSIVTEGSGKPPMMHADTHCSTVASRSPMSDARPPARTSVQASCSRSMSSPPATPTGPPPAPS